MKTLNRKGVPFSTPFSPLTFTSFYFNLMRSLL